MAPKGSVEKPTAVAAQEIHRDTILAEKKARDLWMQKYGSEYITKFHECQKASENARKTVGFPSAYQEDTSRVPWSEVPPEFRRTKNVQLENDELGLWGDYDIERGLIDKDAYKIKKVVWD